MSAALLTHVWQAPTPTDATERLLLLMLADNAGDAGLVQLDAALVAARCALPKEEIPDVVERLVQRGHLRRAGDLGEDGWLQLLHGEAAS